MKCFRGWGDSSVGDWFIAQTGEPEFKPPTPMTARFRDEGPAGLVELVNSLGPEKVPTSLNKENGLERCLVLTSDLLTRVHECAVACTCTNIHSIMHT